MIYLHKDLKNKGLSNYQIQKLVSDGKLFLVKDVYSTDKEINYLEYITKKHPNAVYTLYTACYIYGILNKLYTPYVIATKQKDRKILDENIKQIFMTNELYEIGISEMTYKSIKMKTYNLERLLIEMIRNKVNIDYNIYEEAMKNFKKLKNLINMKRLEEYISYFKDPKIRVRIQNDVFNS